MGAKKITELKRIYSSNNDDLLILQKPYGTRAITKEDFLAGYSFGGGGGTTVNGNSISKKFTVIPVQWIYNASTNKYEYKLTHEMDIGIEEIIVNFYSTYNNTRVLLDYIYIDSNNIFIMSDTNTTTLVAVTKTVSTIGTGEGEVSELNDLKILITELTRKVNVLTEELEETKNILEQHTTLL